MEERAFRTQVRPDERNTMFSEPFTIYKFGGVEYIYPLDKITTDEEEVLHTGLNFPGWSR